MMKQFLIKVKRIGFKATILKSLRMGYRGLFRLSFPNWPFSKMKDRIYSNSLILDLLNSDAPCFVGRIGSNEGHIVANYNAINSNEWLIRKMWHYIVRDTELPWWDEKLIFRLQNNAGFFSNSLKSDIERFAKLYIKYIPTMDVCGRWSHYEDELPFSDQCKMVELESLYPFFVENSWMKALKGKRVLVVHPFSETIKSQYKKRKLIFPNEEWLPEFELKVIKAVQSMAGEKHNLMIGLKLWSI